MGFNLSDPFRLPKCIKRNSLKRLLNKVESVKELNEETPYDMSEIELARFATKHCTDQNVEKIYYNKRSNNK